MNEAESQPQLNVQLARVYLNAADAKLGTRTWQEVMETAHTGGGSVERSGDGARLAGVRGRAAAVGD